MPEIVQWSDELQSDFTSWDRMKQGHALFIEQHPDYPAYLLVNSLDPLFAHTLRDTIGEYRAVHKLDISKLLGAADESGFEPIISTSDPKQLFGFTEHLTEPLPVKLTVDLYPFQLRGFNYLKDLPASICNWSTGTGKSLFGVAWAKYLLETDQIDKVMVLSKSHNKYNWVRQFKVLGELDAATDEDAKGKDAATKRLNRGQIYYDEKIVILNYEKLRYRPANAKVRKDLTGRQMPSASGDGQELEDALSGLRVAWILDEAPTKLKSMQTGWYKGLSELQRNTKSNRITALTATKLEKNPEDLYSWVNLLDKSIWPNKSVFRSMYAKHMMDWRVLSWDMEKLSEIGMRLAHITSRADKYLDPEIRDQFPEFHHEDIYVDLYPGERKIYDAIRADVKKAPDNLTIASLTPLQIACNNISFLGKSNSELAKRISDQYKPTDAHLAKLEKLEDMLSEIPGKVVIFSAWTEFGSLMLAPYIAKWGYQFVGYGGSAKKKQLAQDRFTNDPDVKIFLSSDQGSDSINLEQAASVIHYDTPWNSSTFTQRQNRIHRITSEHLHVYSYTLVASHTLEEKKLAIIEKKRQMEAAVDQALDSQAELMTSFSTEDLLWLIS